VLNENSAPNGGLGWDDARLADETAGAMRDLAGTVTDAPPLRLTAQAPATSRARAARRARGSRRWSWGAPVLAAVAVVAVAVALVIVRDSPNGRVTTPSPTPAVPGAADVPGYYVAWMQADRPYLVVGSTLTGKQFAMVPSPPGIYLDAVYGGAADDRTWVVQGTNQHGPVTETEWYLLTIAPGTAHPVEMRTLAIPVRENPAGAAVSPGGKEVAVAVSGSPATLRIYSVVTGARLRAWSAPSGQFEAVKEQPGSWPYTQLALRWTADGRQVAFVWNAKAIRAIDAAAPDGSLLAGSSVLSFIGTADGPDATYTCKAWQGWEPVEGGRGVSNGHGVICAGGVQDELGGQSSNGTASPAACSARTQPMVGFLKQTLDSQGYGYTGLTASETECPATAQAGDGAYIGWSNGDGSVLIGSLVWDGHTRFGIFRGRRFTPLPALPISMPAGNGVLLGTDAW
jgi:hypothetical protein